VGSFYISPHSLIVTGIFGLLFGPHGTAWIGIRKGRGEGQRRFRRGLLDFLRSAWASPDNGDLRSVLTGTKGEGRGEKRERERERERGGHLDLPEHQEPVNDLAEHDVLSVQKVGLARGEVELAAVGVGPVVCHGSEERNAPSTAQMAY